MILTHLNERMIWTHLNERMIWTHLTERMILTHLNERMILTHLNKKMILLFFKEFPGEFHFVYIIYNILSIFYVHKSGKIRYMRGKNEQEVK